MADSAPPVVVWGNCQAAPLARLLEPALTAYGWRVVPVPPVFEADEDDLAALHELLPHAAALITQPVRDEYHIPGCGSHQLTEHLPNDGRVVTFPVTYDSTPFPFQVNAHLGDGTRIDAPITDYHDLRAIVAAERGLDADAALAWWPAPEADAVRENADRNRAELERRETRLDVPISDRIFGTPEPAMFTLSHPRNAILAEVARRVLQRLDVPGEVEIPEREFLGQRRAPVEAAVAGALGWPDETVGDHWIVDKQPVDPRALIQNHLEFYAEHPDIVTDARRRFADRLELLGL